MERALLDIQDMLPQHRIADGITPN